MTHMRSRDMAEDRPGTGRPAPVACDPLNQAAQGASVTPEALLHAVFGGLPEGVLVVDRAGELIHASRKMRRMVASETLLAPGLPVDAVFAPSFRACVWAQIEHAVCDGAERREGASVALAGSLPGGSDPASPNGVGRAVRVLVEPLRAPDGGVIAAVLHVHDMADEARLAPVSPLGGRGQRLQAVGQLALSIAHDFRNLLTAVTGAADSILECLGAEAAPGCPSRLGYEGRND